MHEATRAVAALLDLAPVGVENPVAEIRAAGRVPFHQQHLVAANAEVAVREAADLFRGQRDRARDAGEHHEVVSGAMHLGEGNWHEPISKMIAAIDGMAIYRVYSSNDGIHMIFLRSVHASSLPVAARQINRPSRRIRLREGRIPPQDRKSTRLNSSHSQISYAVF